jgi:hypothetical protein
VARRSSGSAGIHFAGIISAGRKRAGLEIRD